MITWLVCSKAASSSDMGADFIISPEHRLVPCFLITPPTPTTVIKRQRVFFWLNPDPYQSYLIGIDQHKQIAGAGIVCFLTPFHEIEVSKNVNDLRVLQLNIRSSTRPHPSAVINANSAPQTGSKPALWSMALYFEDMIQCSTTFNYLEKKLCEVQTITLQRLKQLMKFQIRMEGDDCNL